MSKLIITYFFAATPAQVWRAWTEPEFFMQWWGPKAFTCPFAELNLKVGRRYLTCMRAPDGKDMWTTGTYLEIVPAKRLVYTDSFANDQGDVVSASYYGMGEDFPIELKVTVSLKTVNGKTEMTLQHEGFPPGELTRLTEAGWRESFAKLATALKTIQ